MKNYLTEEILKKIAFDCPNLESEGDHELCKEARDIWSIQNQSENGDRKALVRKFNEVSRYLKIEEESEPILQIAKSKPDKICSKCHGRGYIQDPYWESVRKTIPCTCNKGGK